MSNIGKDIEAAAEFAAPQIGISVAAAKVVAWTLAAIAVLVVGGWVIWKLFFAQHQAEQKTQQLQIKADQATQQATQASGKDAVHIVVDNGKGAAAVDAAVKGAVSAILAAKGSNQQIDPDLDGLGRRAICVRVSAASLPECQSLQRPGP